MTTRSGQGSAPGTGAADTGASDREIITTRRLDAPRQLVFDAFTRPEHLARWWGPTGFTLTTHEFDFRAGGAWRFVMHGPDGTDYRNEMRFVEIVRPERIVYSHTTGPKFEMTVTFDDDGRGATLLTMRHRFATATERDETIRVFNAAEGAKQTLARLAEFLANG